MTKWCIRKYSTMLSKVYFYGGPIVFLYCTESTGKFFHRFSNFNQVWGAFLPKRFCFWNHLFFTFKRGVLSVLIYFRLNLISEVIIQRIAVWWFWRLLIFFDITLRYGFFQKILNEITDMERCIILKSSLFVDRFY